MNKSQLQFDNSISRVTAAQGAWRVLAEFSKALDGHKLFTVMTVDMEAGLARRAYSDHPTEYPTTGTKPIHKDAWFDLVHGQKLSFVANTIVDIAKVFPDFELIQSLGCGSVINLPVILRGDLVATVNLLHVEHHYTAARVKLLETQLSLPAKLCFAIAEQCEGGSDG